MENTILIFSCSCFFPPLLLILFFSCHIFLDLSLMEEWPSRGKTLERHDESSAYRCCPMARSQSLKDPPTKSKQHLQNPVDMHKFKHGYQKPSNYLSLSLSLCLYLSPFSIFFLQFVYGDPSFIHCFYFFPPKRG